MTNGLNFITQLAVIPGELTPKEDNFTFEIGLTLFVAFLFLSFARLVKPGIYGNIGVGMMKVTSLRAFIRENIQLNKRGSLFLLVNYWLSTGLVIHLLLNDYQLEFFQNIIISSITPLILLFGVLASLNLTGWVTGERDVIKDPIIMKILGAQSLGIIYFLCALIWVLNPMYQEIIIQIVVFAFAIELAVRVIKSITVVYARGVSWYYIILYLCTLEILPLFVTYYYGIRNFGD